MLEYGLVPYFNKNGQELIDFIIQGGKLPKPSNCSGKKNLFI